MLDSIFDDEDDVLAAVSVVLSCDGTNYRSGSLYRRRWDSGYLVNLAPQNTK
jgi:hypothetical protein